MSKDTASGRRPWRAFPSALIVASVASASAFGCSGVAREGVEANAAMPRRASDRAIAPAHAAQVGRFAIGRAEGEALAFEVLAVPGGQSALLVSQAAEEPTAFARRIDSDGKMGPILRVDDAWIYRAFDASDGATTLVTADGRAVCVASYPRGESTPMGRGCRESAPALAAPIGDRVAFFETEITRPVEAARPVAAPRPARHAHAPKETKPAHPGPVKRAPKADVTVKVRFASKVGEFETEASPIGLVFKQPQEGLRLLDAQPRAGGVDLLWFDWAPERKNKSPLGGAHLVAGHVLPDGTLDKTSRIAVTDGDLEYGFVKDRKGARLATSEAGSVLVALDRKPECVVFRAEPKWARLPTNPLLCAIDPARFAKPEPAQQELDALLRIEKLEPRRAVGQSKSDFGLVAWAGDRAVFLQGRALYTAPRATGEARAEPEPFASKRAHLRWGAFASDGEGVAVVGDNIVHVSVSGEVELTAIRPEATRAGALRAAEETFERRRVARIGNAFWLARADGMRVWPSPSPAHLPAESGAFDASALVGGEARGVLIQVSGEGDLVATAIDGEGAANGAAAPAGLPFPSPVRVGFGAAARASGGAIVAGASVSDPSRVAAFVVDAGGRAGPALATPLTLKPGEMIVRVEAFPAGGAWLSDASRSEVIWLDDDARPIAGAPWPKEQSIAACVDGRPARAFVPSPSPGLFVHVAELAAPGTCLVGEPTWAKDGTLRWFGSRAKGLDVEAELGVVRPEIPASQLAPLAVEKLAAPPELGEKKRACPLEMVLVAKKLCVDRFEDILVDKNSFELLSPDYAATSSLEEAALGEWATGRERTGNVLARAMPLPTPPPAHRHLEPLAISRFGVRPNGYVSGLVAEKACAAAGKRLCGVDEFVLACRGEDDTLAPYGDSYEDRACNVNRDEHPAATLHDSASVGHLDPRLDRVPSALGGSLYQTTGQSPACRSRWGSDAAYDMVGNVDEWVDHGAGAFAGGFYSRATKSGCEALVANHPRTYLDYSTGVRCCKDPATVAPSVTSPSGVSRVLESRHARK